MTIERQDAQVEVKVPAQNGRKAYSYFRNASAIKKGAVGAGAALALGGLAAAAIALRKKPEESNALPAPVETPAPVTTSQSTASRVGEFAKKAAISTGKNVAGVATSLALSKGISTVAAPIIGKIMYKQYEAGGEARRARWRAEEAADEEKYAEYKKKRDLEAETIGVKTSTVESAPNRQLPLKPKPEIGGAIVLVGKSAEAPKATEKPRPPRFREQDEWTEGEPLATPVMINGKINPQYLEAVTRSSFDRQSEEPMRLARNIAAKRAGLVLSPESQRLSGVFTTPEIKAAGQFAIKEQIARGEYLAPPDSLPSPNGVLPSAKPKFEIPRILIPPARPQSALSSALTVTPSESPKSAGNAIASPQKSKLTEMAGNAGAALGKVVGGAKKVAKEGLERDSVARKKLAGRVVDLNEASRKAGAATRLTFNAVDNFARSFMQTFVDDNKTIDVRASEVKTTQRAIPKRTKRANKTMSKIWNRSTRRYESIDERIDSFVEQLREDAKVEVKVPAAQGRKAYSYFREGGGKTKVGAIIGGLAVAGLGAAAIAATRRTEGSGTPSLSLSPSSPASASQSTPNRVGEIAKKAAIAAGAGFVAREAIVKPIANDIRFKVEEKKRAEVMATERDEMEKAREAREKPLNDMIAREEKRKADLDQFMKDAEAEKSRKWWQDFRAKNEAEKPRQEAVKKMLERDAEKAAADEFDAMISEGFKEKSPSRNSQKPAKEEKKSRPNKTKARVWNKASRRYESIDERIDSFVEQLREDAKCGSGTKPCGKICIPQEKNCAGETAKAFGGGALQALAGPIGSGTYRALRSRGHGRGMSIGGAIAANVGTTVGMVGLGAVAAKKAEDEELKRGKK